ncbi:hypothetical protein DFJ58DRAFT_141402 [Suillus subalutaceus]|uniref:uncharacterized protein n=1 Tax=Suillus subalutaceus TaxID=48586 RepID=UPI001B87867D|nr:uncharacterized protein DFJ58DRAFT_141402 [Suillus subalutaceus]KAG1866585.1 hypothetical protein DFJ58DRAFT_141402 [Suillus subalutaceus]
MFIIVVAEMVTTSTMMIHRGPCVLNMIGASRVGIGQPTKVLRSNKIGERLLHIRIEVAAMAGNRTTDGGRMIGEIIIILIMTTTTTTTAVAIIESFNSETMVGTLAETGNLGRRMCKRNHPRMNGLGSLVPDGKRVAPTKGASTIAIAITETRIKTRKIRIKIVFGWRRREIKSERESSAEMTMTMT